MIPDGGYRRFVRRRFGSRRSTRDLRHAIGGEFAAFGVVEREMLKHYGLTATSRLIDVGCGAGRLTTALRGWFTGSYLGTDVVPEFVAATRAAAQPDWSVVQVRDLQIPADEASADVVCFFSVFTHLLHEHSYRYLAEAHRVLRNGGRVVFSFLEFREESHWAMFEGTIAAARERSDRTLNVFLSREAIAVWAHHLGFRVVDIRNGSDRFVPLPHPVVLDSGETMDELGCLGQSICVLERV